jgi:predicted nucleic acid-binding protein
MKTVFADAFYYFALLSPTSNFHKEAMEFTADFAGTVVTTAWILTEVADGLSREANRPLFLELIDELQVDPDVVIVEPDKRMFENGLDLFRDRPDKEWTLTDCISFVVMKEQKIRDALTADHHFEQAGFNVLFKRQK